MKQPNIVSPAPDCRSKSLRSVVSKGQTEGRKEGRKARGEWSHLDCAILGLCVLISEISKEPMRRRRLIAIKQKCETRFRRRRKRREWRSWRKEWTWHGKEVEEEEEADDEADDDVRVDGLFRILVQFFSSFNFLLFKESFMFLNGLLIQLNTKCMEANKKRKQRTARKTDGTSIRISTSALNKPQHWSLSTAWPDEAFRSEENGILRVGSRAFHQWTNQCMSLVRLLCLVVAWQSCLVVPLVWSRTKGGEGNNSSSLCRPPFFLWFIHSAHSVFSATDFVLLFHDTLGLLLRELDQEEHFTTNTISRVDGFTHSSSILTSQLLWTWWYQQ